MTFPLIKRAKGQAMVLFMGFAAAMIGMMLVSFNSGQVTNAKMRAMNAADAAAYSAALWEARSLNFQAYMNRAMVVNEVTVAQSVSLRSWVDYLARFVSDVNMVTQFVPWLGEATTAISEALDEGNDIIQKALPLFEQAARTAAHFENEAQITFNALGDANAIAIAIDVAKKNGAEISKGGMALFANNTADWVKFTENYSTNNRPAGTSGDGRKRLRAVALDSRDGFTHERKWNWNFVILKVDKQGGTDLVNYDAWKGLDSAALCTTPWKCGWVPLGWGGAQAYKPKANGIGTHGDTSNWNRVDGQLARTEANSSSRAAAMQYAFPDYRDLQVLDTSKTAQQKIPFAVEVLIADTKVPTANSAFGAQAVLLDGTKINHDPQYAGTGAGVYGLAEACVSFERPPGATRKDGGVERPSLFNPYWHAALATPSKTTRSVAGIAKGLPPVDALFGGTGSCG